MSYYIIIDTDSYSGNFERVLGAFLTGIEPAGVNTFVRRALKCARDDFDCDTEEESPFFDLIEKRMIKSDDDQLITTFVEMAPTPGWSNDGNGKHYKVSEKRQFKYDAFQSVSLFCKREPIKEEVELIKLRLKKYPRCLPRIGQDFAETMTFKPTAVRLYLYSPVYSYTKDL